MRHLHLAFVAVTLLLIVVVLLTPQAGESGDAATPQGAVLERTYDPTSDGLVCCTWRDGAQERRCVAASGQTCDVCAGACG